MLALVRKLKVVNTKWVAGELSAEQAITMRDATLAELLASAGNGGGECRMQRLRDLERDINPELSLLGNWFRPKLCCLLFRL